MYDDAKGRAEPSAPVEPPRWIEPESPPEVQRFWSSFWSDVAGHPRRLVAAVVATTVGMGVVVDVQQPSASTAENSVAPLDQPQVKPEQEKRAPPPPSSPVLRYRALAKQAVKTCPGLPTGVLFAIAEVETNLGRNKSVSRAGAIGPMQFLPGTWRAYATDGDGDGRADITNPADAVHTAARHLCANGGAEPERLRAAIWNYNRSEVYVERVLALAEVSPP